MNRFAVLIASGAVVALVLSCLAGRLYSQEEKKVNEPAVRIGLVDLQEVSTKFRKWIRLAGELEKEGEKTNKKLGEMEEELEKLEKQLEQLKEGTEEHRKAQIQISGKKIEMKGFYDDSSRRLKGMAERSGNELLGDMEEEIRRYGKENGFTLILKKDELSGKKLDWNEMQKYVFRKVVLYCADPVDLTDIIVWKLNQRHK